MMLSVSAAYAENREVKVIGNGTVIIDHDTNLMWASGGLDAGCNYGITEKWIDAVNYCRGLDYALRQDWRLPTKAELLSINYEQTHSALIAPYWSSTDDGTDFAWYVLFRSDYVTASPKTERNYVRCVRAYTVKNDNSGI